MAFNVPPHKRPRVDLQRLGVAANLFLSISDRLVRKRRVCFCSEPITHLCEHLVLP